MSRYVQVDAEPRTLVELESGLVALRLTALRNDAGGRVMLEGSVECPGEPVDLRLAAGTLGSVEDFGFTVDPSGIRLVCGEVDRTLLEQALLGPLRVEVARLRARAAAEHANLDLSERVEPDGTRRIVVKRK